MPNYIGSLGSSSAVIPRGILMAKTIRHHFIYLKSEYIPTPFMEMKSRYVES